MSSRIIEIIKENSKKIEKATNRLDCLATLFNAPESKFTTKNGGFCYEDNIEASTVFQTEDTTVTLAIWKKAQAVYPVHCHKDSVEYLMVIKGSFLLKFGGAVRIMSKGECASIPAGVDHTVTSLEGDSQMLAVCIPPEIAYQ
jgi:mannose-6-phosphate isomerase-like protein (cupin superfamily)